MSPYSQYGENQQACIALMLNSHAGLYGPMVLRGPAHGEAEQPAHLSSRQSPPKPFHTLEKESPLPPSGPQVLTRLRRMSPHVRNKRLGSQADSSGEMAPDWPAAPARRNMSR